MGRIELKVSGMPLTRVLDDENKVDHALGGIDI